MTPPKRDPYGENPGLYDGYAWCDECQGDGGGEYCKGFSPSIDGPDYEWIECSMCDGTGQLMTMEKALEEDAKKLEQLSTIRAINGESEAFTLDDGSA